MNPLIKIIQKDELFQIAITYEKIGNKIIDKYVPLKEETEILKKTQRDTLNLLKDIPTKQKDAHILEIQEKAQKLLEEKINEDLEEIYSKYTEAMAVIDFECIKYISREESDENNYKSIEDYLKQNDYSNLEHFFLKKFFAKEPRITDGEHQSRKEVYEARNDTLKIMNNSGIEYSKKINKN